ncbi:hypothetical protein 7S11_4 [uncultured Caudovirales phage]|uniref:Head-to-tail adaptor n=1 Tax=uncultured Caudovirales phage TaxID=2100421 RepID=A0A2H4IYA5_9CAUD|nr:hypothetical protein 7S11_4 [uncultured Caudovirales phage]
MPAVQIGIPDLQPFAPGIDPAKAEAMIEDALALATQIAPCIVDVDFKHPGAAKAIMRGAILRWNEGGTGAITQQSAGPFQQTVDTTNARRSLFWPSEIAALQKLCGGGDTKAFAVDTVATSAVMHAETCSVVFGAAYCDCGAALTGGFPLWGE